MPCHGCYKSFRDKEGDFYGVPRSSHHSLCYDCMCKALQIYECEPKQLLNLYLHLRKNGIYIPEELIKDQATEAEVRMYDPTDRMFNARD